MRGPAWIRDELILALDVYFELDYKDIVSTNPLIIELSDFLRSLPIHEERFNYDKFRNPNGASMEMMNFLKYDSNYKKIGLLHSNKLQYVVWNDYVNNKDYLHRVAMAIKHCLPLPFEYSHLPDLDQNDFREGTILYQYHKFIECEPKRVGRLLKKAHDIGLCACSICSFDYFEAYGMMGYGFMECHHAVPIIKYNNAMAINDSDFVLVCSNCHRMLHRTKINLDKYNIKNILAKDN